MLTPQPRRSGAGLRRDLEEATEPIVKAMNMGVVYTAEDSAIKAERQQDGRVKLSLREESDSSASLEARVAALEAALAAYGTMDLDVCVSGSVQSVTVVTSA